MMPLQLALSLTLPDEPSLENFITGRNAEAVAQIHEVAHGVFGHTALYLWGEAGAGKTHVLQGLSRLPNAMMGLPELLLDDATAGALYLIDDVHLLTDEQQTALFHLYNRARANQQTLVLTANAAPSHLPLSFLPDLKTRLAWDLVYQLQLLTDENKAQVLEQQAIERGLSLAPDVVPYMLRHLTRDLSQLHAILQHLDEYSLRAKRALTLPLLKEWLNTQESTN
jgi:DnaA family protein